MKNLYFLTHLLWLTPGLGAPAAWAQAQAPAPRVTITGKVTSADGKEELPGVTVLLKGTNNGTGTGPDGSYTLQVPATGGTLIFSYVGYATQEVQIAGQSVVNVRLQGEAKGLDEVVVVGYGSQKKSDVTGALSSVSAKEIQQVQTQNLTQALQGRAAGVDVAGGNFRPGEVPSIRIRGNRSVRASNEPLYVVDGIPLAQGTGLNDFNPQDIQSVEILKDASATAIYGSRGANGVIIVTTKRGQEGKFSINYNTYFSADRAARTLDLFSGGGFLEVQREAYRTNGTYGALYADPARDFALFGAKDLNAWEGIADGYEWVDRANRVVATRATTDAEKALYGASVTQIPIYDASKVRTTDWQDLALRTALTQNHQLSASGGTDKLRASVAVGYLKQNGIQRGQDFARYNARATLDLKVNPYITLGASTNASLAVQNYGPDIYGRAAGQLPYAVPYAPDGSFITNPGGDPLIFNPLREQDNAFNERRVTRFFGSFYADVNLAFVKGLRYRLNVGPDFRNNRTGTFQSARAIARDAGGPNSISAASYDQSQNFTYVVENLLFYDRQFGDKHSLGLTALQSVQADRGEGSSVSALNLPYDSQKWYNLGSTYRAAAQGFGSSFSARQLASWMGRANYGYLDRYLLTLTGRADASSVLADNNKWSFFPSVAVAWKIQQESFLRDVAVVSELKLRGGYGTVGQASVDPYTTGGTLQQSAYAFNETPAYGYSPTPGTLPGTLGGNPNRQLRWERTSTLNVGLDFGFFKNRITGSVEVYRANTTDLLLPRALPAVSGVVSSLQNIGATRNSGIEVGMTTVNVEKKNFRWSTDYVFTRNKEEFVSLGSGAGSDVGNRWFIGQPLGVYYNYQNNGIWQTSEADEARKFGARPGDTKVVDQDGNNLINANDFVILGSNRPKWSGSINNVFTYKAFELSFLVYARVGQLLSSGYVPGLGGRYPGLAVDYWTPTNPSNEYPRPALGQDDATNSGGYAFQSGSFVRVRNISLTYTVPPAISTKLRASNLAIYVNAVNPFLFTKFRGLDPEASDVGSTSGERVQARNLGTKSLIVGLRLGF
ncbi:MAG TPA: TonB-dependent receptor [Hymenobacter sp.]|uniref:SusC/RagA family TonB-linked outer membrane protein n=1 Tax=Hymenobacter sp. TaxID=1898978 RepID=UPI002D8004FB|nr:TonB-dependent receptor [Hymenobacter sp.]HET9505429.1 TonB-dependent receptor [Hymenobacter sp.]